MLAIDRAEEDANNRQLSEHTALMDELYGTNLVFNCTSLRWYRPVRPARCVCRFRRLSSYVLQIIVLRGWLAILEGA